MAGLVDYGVDSDRESNESPNNSSSFSVSQKRTETKPLPNDASKRTKETSFDKESRSSKSGHSNEVHKSSSSSSKHKDIDRHHKHRKRSRSRNRSRDRNSHSRKRSRSKERKEHHRDERKKRCRSKSRSRSRSSSLNRKDRKSSRRTRSQERREKKAATIARMGLDVTNVAASLAMPSAESKHPSVTNLSPMKQTSQFTSSAAGSSSAVSSAVQAAAQQVLQSRVAEAQQVTGVTLPSFYNPAAVNPMKYAQQIQKRKLLWANKEKNEPPATSTAKIWEATAFTQDQDGKMTAKFKRLMGIKNDSSDGAAAGPSRAVDDRQPESATDVLKKQQELFASLDQQYQVARATTHTQRGLGLGFGSANSSYPR
uniref:EOG090X0LFN n=1 Tax=Daphnia magna TaxID=35525 RepID=A0A4Y7MHT1_9CRUS|nr:EOG090X0LFN [Daphnia magna]SVE82310.1 EOG090X0LFN [Daphnia magna]